MKTSQQTTFRIVIFAVAVTAFLVAPGFPLSKFFEAKPSVSAHPKIERARTVPISDKVIRARITLDGFDSSFEIDQFEGGLIRTETADGAIYGFSPIMTDLSSESVTIKAYRISRMTGASGAITESLIQVHTLVADKAGHYFTTYADAEASFKIEILGVQPSSGARTAQADLTLLSEDCCVRCRGTKSCGCRVVSQCGGCCDGPCCNLSQAQ